MDSFVAKRGRDRLRVIQKKSYHFDPFQPYPKWGFQKKKQKNKNHHNGFISSQNGMGQAESDTKKKK